MRSSLVVLAVLATTAVAAPAATAAPPPPSGCAEVGVITVRGTNEPQGGGTVVGPLASSIQAASARTVSIEHLVYAASAVYPVSVPEGQTRLVNRVESQAAACPSQQFVLTGYSLGAWIVGNALAGNGTFSNGRRVSAATGQRVTAVAQFGNPTFHSAEPFDAGTFTRGRNGSAGARPTGSLSTFSARIRDYCNALDNVCQTRGSLAPHLDYGKYRPDATRFVVGRTG